MSRVIERPDALSVARGFVGGNPPILQIRQRAKAEAEKIIRAVANAVAAEFGPSPLRIPVRKTAVIARKD